MKSGLPNLSVERTGMNRSGYFRVPTPLTAHLQNRMKAKFNAQRAFTLIELLVVIALIAILAALL